MIKEDLWNAYGYAMSIWSSFKLPSNDFEQNIMNEVWFETLKPYDTSLVLFAMKEYAKTCDFCNIVKVAELCEKYIHIAKGDVVCEDAICREIREAILKVDKNTAFEKMSPIAREVVGGAWQLFKWGMIDSTQVESVVIPTVRKAVNRAIQRAKDKATVDRLMAKNLLRIEDVEEKPMESNSHEEKHSKEDMNALFQSPDDVDV